MASPWNQHCANCIGTHVRSLCQKRERKDEPMKSSRSISIPSCDSLRKIAPWCASRPTGSLSSHVDCINITPDTASHLGSRHDAARSRSAGACSRSRTAGSCRSILLRAPALSSKPAAYTAAAVDRRDRQTDGRTDDWLLHRLCSAYYAGSANRQNGPAKKRTSLSHRTELKRHELSRNWLGPRCSWKIFFSFFFFLLYSEAVNSRQEAYRVHQMPGKTRNRRQAGRGCLRQRTHARTHRQTDNWNT